MLKTNINLQDHYLNELSSRRIQLSIYLINGIKLSGYIASFDQIVVVLTDKGEENNQLIYKHAISTIVPLQKIDLSQLNVEKQD